MAEGTENSHEEDEVLDAIRDLERAKASKDEQAIKWARRRLLDCLLRLRKPAGRETGCDRIRCAG